MKAKEIKELRRNLGLNSLFIPSMSWITKTCPSTPPPAPIPITGIEMLLATFSAKCAGIFSKTNAKHPNFSSNLASSTSFSASAKVAMETGGPASGAAPNAGGAPAGGADGFCSVLSHATAAESRL